MRRSRRCARGLTSYSPNPSRELNYDLAGELAEFDERFAEVTEEQVRAALADAK